MNLMVDKSLLHPVSVQKKLDEIVGKYFSIVEFLAWVEHAWISIDLQIEEAKKVGWPQEKELVVALEGKKSTLALQEWQMSEIFLEMYPKYSYFAEIIGKKLSGKTIEVWWVSIHKDLLVKEALEQFIEQLNDKLVECEAVFFSLPIKRARNDAEKDKVNLIKLDYMEKQTQNSVEDLTKKLYVFTTLLWEMK